MVFGGYQGLALSAGVPKVTKMVAQAQVALGVEEERRRAPVQKVQGSEGQARRGIRRGREREQRRAEVSASER